MKFKFSEHQADHFEEQAPVCGSRRGEAADKRAVGSLQQPGLVRGK